MRSTTSWPIPQPTDVLSYVYLWAREAEGGRDEGSKERPVVVVLATEEAGAGTAVTVAPVTTKRPGLSDVAVEMPAAVRAHLGLGDAPCWIVASELNRFLWPGPDLRPVRARGAALMPYYGKVPAKLVEQLRERYREIGAASLAVVQRSG